MYMYMKSCLFTVKIRTHLIQTWDSWPSQQWFMQNLHYLPCSHGYTFSLFPENLFSLIIKYEKKECMLNSFQLTHIRQLAARRVPLCSRIHIPYCRTLRIPHKLQHRYKICNIKKKKKWMLKKYYCVNFSHVFNNILSNITGPNMSNIFFKHLMNIRHA